MSIPVSHSAQPARRSALALRCVAAAALCFSLSGCQNIVGNTSFSQVRVIDASPDAPGLDVYLGTGALTYNLGFGTVTSYVPIQPGPAAISVDASGSRQVLASARNTFETSAQYTVLVGNTAASLQELILKDQSQPAPSGQISLRFIDQATRITAVDVYLVPTGSKITGVTPVFVNLTFGTNTGYINVPTGTYTLVMLPAGTIPTATSIATYTGSQITYPGGSARTYILIDTQIVTTPGLQVISASDYDSATATS